ncbi:DUF2249 domain-containing protein [Halovenus sp. WSH3]|uniref:DUF2249 domain-containing protein n=1 Tax=Halovenus carboxidivorans TaxID=2692199 RepID=A0A6B0T5U2_9EURY|nr:DUF2249 domain-containing protein [Halovenus carboxidivorans]MXR50933.1 DUF2249 domain-containing protein [Halovenus carboxidivorans]
MSRQLDLSDEAVEDYYDQLTAALAESSEIEVVADADPTITLRRYEIEHRQRLQWTVDRAGEDWAVTVEASEEMDETALPAFDVRSIPPQRRHSVLTGTFDGLDAGDGFVLVNDHDPKPLYHELRSLYGDIVDWEYESRGGEDGWRVEITKTDSADGDDSDVHTKFDVREIPKHERHSTIHHRYGMIPEGEVMEIVAPHEPRPLKNEFDQQYGDSFSWEVVEKEPNKCRVQITKGGDRTDESADLEVVRELDVRDLPPAQRHEQIFEAYGELEPDTGFVLVNDHDPKPLYHQFEAEAGPEFYWEYQKQEPGEFRVLIGRSEADPDSVPEDGQRAPF